jgi:hypothetical protein
MPPSSFIAYCIIKDGAEFFEFTFMRLEAQTDIAQGVERGDLPEQQLDELVPTVQIADAMVAAITFHVLLKLANIS